MNIVSKHEQFKNKTVFAVSGINSNYGVTTTQCRCLFYFISTFSHIYLIQFFFFEDMLRTQNRFLASTALLTLNISIRISLINEMTLL